MKYIYKLENPLDYVFVYDSPNEHGVEQKLFMEIEDDVFLRVMDSLEEQCYRPKKVEISEAHELNITAASFLKDLLYELIMRKNLSTIPFRIKIYQDANIMVYSRMSEISSTPMKAKILIPPGHSIEEIEFFRLAFNADESRLPCPFCGHAPEFWPDLEYKRVYISCPNCTCEVHGDTVRECFERWNRRTGANND